MPPTTKQQTKKKEAEEGKAEKKAVKAKKAVVAALLLFVALAAFVHAQTTGNTTAAKGNATEIVNQIKDWTVGGVGLVVTIFGIMFWAAVGIAIFHIAMSYIAPTRFQRLGAMWDAVERAKDIAIGLAVLFAVFYGVMAAGAVISGNFSTEKAFDLFFRIVSKPFVDIYNEIIKAISPQPGTSPTRTGP